MRQACRAILCNRIFIRTVYDINIVNKTSNEASISKEKTTKGKWVRKIPAKIYPGKGSWESAQVC